MIRFLKEYFLPFRIQFCPSAKTFVIRFSTRAFSSTFSSENPPHGRGVRISPPYAHIQLMNSFSTCKNGRNPLHLAAYAHPVGFTIQFPDSRPNQYFSKCINHPGNYQYFPKCISHPGNYQYSPNVSAILETINNFPLRNRILHALHILKHRLCGFASVFCDDLHNRTSYDNTICGGSHLLCLLRC